MFSRSPLVAFAPRSPIPSLHAFRSPSTSPPRRAAPQHRRPRARVRAQVGGESSDRVFPEQPEPLPENVYGDKKFRYDPDSEKDAFGRDPKAETDFWRSAAQEVIGSEPVREAVENFEADGGDGYTEEQREYLRFIESLDQGESGQQGGNGKEGTDEGKEQSE